MMAKKVIVFGWETTCKPNIAQPSKLSLTMNFYMFNSEHQAEQVEGLGSQPVTGEGGAGYALLPPFFWEVKVKLSRSKSLSAICQIPQPTRLVGDLTKVEHTRPFLSFVGSVDESLGTGPSFSKESSSVAASRHLHNVYWETLNNDESVTVATEWEDLLNLGNITGKEMGSGEVVDECNVKEKTSCSLEGPRDALLVHI